MPGLACTCAPNKGLLKRQNRKKKKVDEGEEEEEEGEEETYPLHLYIEQL